jgi:PAS domain S-box-containing protein
MILRMLFFGDAHGVGAGMRKLNKLSAGPRARLATRERPKRHMGDGGGVPGPGDWRVALIDGSDDAIVSKNLNGIIQSWNGGATRLFGYSADEAIGKSTAILIPEDRLEEESAILALLRRGKRVGSFETKRRRKDGSLIDISLTISVIRNEGGVIVGVSKIARDITEKLMAQEQQRLLMCEMRHRVKNLFALAVAIVSISARSSASGRMIDDICARLSSLARAHDLTMADRPHDAANRLASSLLTLIRRILDPYAAADGRVVIGGDDCDVGAKAVPYLSLLLHELATNAAKFGSLSVGSGRLDVSVAVDGDLVRLVWRETGGPAPSAGKPAGFGSRLERSVTCVLKTTIERDWRRTGLVATIVIPKAVLSA